MYFTLLLGHVFLIYINLCIFSLSLSRFSFKFDDNKAKQATNTKLFTIPK